MRRSCASKTECLDYLKLKLLQMLTPLIEVGIRYIFLLNKFPLSLQIAELRVKIVMTDFGTMLQFKAGYLENYMRCENIIYDKNYTP